jgi:hypothetical protein
LRASTFNRSTVFSLSLQRFSETKQFGTGSSRAHARLMISCASTSLIQSEQLLGTFNYPL